MTEEMKSKSRFRKQIMTLAILLGIVLLSCTTVYLLFYNEIRTLMSIKRISSSPIYKIVYHGDYALDQYLYVGADSWEDVLKFLNENLGRGTGQYIYGQNQCSSFFAKTPEGDYILARNLDTQTAIPGIIEANTNNGHKTIGIVNLALGGWDENNIISKLSVIGSPYYTLDGINEYGLAIASSSVPIEPNLKLNEEKITIHDLTVNRVIIDKARDVEEAIHLLSNFNIKEEYIYPNHYMIADRKGNCVVIEYIDGEMKVIKMTGNYQIVTNSVLYNNEALKYGSDKRYTSFDQTLSSCNGVITIEDALELLEKNVVLGMEQWSVVYNLSKNTMAIKFHNAEEKIYYYDLDK